MITGKSIEIQSVTNGYIISSDILGSPYILLTDIEVLRFVERFFKMADINIAEFEPDTQSDENVDETK